MEERKLEWIANDDWDTKHSVSETFAIKTLKTLYDEYPGGLEEMESCHRTLASSNAKQKVASTQVIQELTELYKKTVKTPMYVLTIEYNDYDQYGEYFIHVWLGKPRKAQLMKYVDENDVEHVLFGGGRRNEENQWYHLHQIDQ